VGGGGEGKSKKCSWAVGAGVAFQKEHRNKAVGHPTKGSRGKGDRAAVEKKGGQTLKNTQTEKEERYKQGKERRGTSKNAHRKQSKTPKT